MEQDVLDPRTGSKVTITIVIGQAETPGRRDSYE